MNETNADSAGEKQKARKLGRLADLVLTRGRKVAGQKKLGVSMSDARCVQTVKDSRGQSYAVMSSGAIRRLSPERPWRGKSERRQAIKARRVFDALESE